MRNVHIIFAAHQIIEHFLHFFFCRLIIDYRNTNSISHNIFLLLAKYSYAHSEWSH